MYKTIFQSVFAVVLDLGTLWQYLGKAKFVGVLPSVVAGETVVPLELTTGVVLEKVRQSGLWFQWSAWV